MKSKAVWVAEKETEKNKNGDTWAKQELKAIKKWSWYFIQLFVLTLYYHTSFYLHIFIFVFFFLYLFTSSCSDWLTKKAIGAYCRKGMKEAEDFRLRDSNIT